MTNVEGHTKTLERLPKAGEGAPSGVDGNVAKRFSDQREMAVSIDASFSLFSCIA